jgi:hypothetical protein
LSISIAHYEEDAHVPMGESLRMWDITSKRAYTELIVCEMEGHVFGCLPRLFEEESG